MAHRLILANELPEEPLPLHIQQAAEAIYLLVHARFVVSPRGLDAVRVCMRRALKSDAALFGRCPRVCCGGQCMLPCALSDFYGDGKVMRYCCSCGEIFHQWDSQIDGCAFGTSFTHLFLMTYGEEFFPELVAYKTSRDANYHGNKEVDSFPTPQIFGFQIHSDAKISYPILGGRNKRYRQR